MSEYQPTIGLEIHSILKTETKMFCGCLNDPTSEKEPNLNTCPICLGHPGTLPVINKKAVESVIKTGLALGGEINPITKFDRKNYFYPDLPKGYQISQFDEPIVLGGGLLGVRIRRVHLEEDAGRLLHEIPGEAKRGDASYVDYNRAGVPLMELVTEPDVRSAEQAVSFAKELQKILRYLKVSDADMEKGQMRIEANVSIDMGQKVEVKNINSFRAVFAAIQFEIERQKEILEKGEKVLHETRGWSDKEQKTVSQRSKEEAHDYRYFPEPDLPPFETSVFDLERMKQDLPEMPEGKKKRFQQEYGLTEKQADILTDDPFLAEYFEQAVSEFKADYPEGDTAPLFNYLTSDLRGLLNEFGGDLSEIKITPENLADLVKLIEEGKIMSRQAKDILRKMYETGEDPEVIMREGGFETISNEDEVSKVIEEVVSENSKAVEDFRGGKNESIQFLVGQAMKKLKGRGNPGSLREILTVRLKEKQ